MFELYGGSSLLFEYAFYASTICDVKAKDERDKCDKRHIRWSVFFWIDVCDAGARHCAFLKNRAREKEQNGNGSYSVDKAIISFQIKAHFISFVPELFQRAKCNKIRHLHEYFI